jgi:hypothetical protein
MAAISFESGKEIFILVSGKRGKSGESSGFSFPDMECDIEN